MKNVNNIFRLQCEPRSSASREDHHTRLIEYDDRMRQEVKKYSRLLTELNNSRWISQSSPHISNKLDGMTPYDIDQTIDEDQLADLEATRLTGDEILHGCGVTMEQVLLEQQKSSMSHDNGSFDRTNTLYSMAFQCTPSLHDKDASNSSLMGTTQVVCNNLVESNAKESIPWQSIMIVPGKFGFKGWSGMYSSSAPVPSKESKEKHAIVYTLCQQNRKEG